MLPLPIRAGFIRFVRGGVLTLVGGAWVAGPRDSIKAQDEDYETPMQPITMLRNALGKEEGGSGVPLDRDKYNASVAYWSKHAVVVPKRNA